MLFVSINYVKNKIKKNKKKVEDDDFWNKKKKIIIKNKCKRTQYTTKILFKAGIQSVEYSETL